jgi:hypothetical protein
MASDYYVNTRAQATTGDHEVHKQGCTWMPSTENRKYLGAFNSCADAVKEAKKTYSTANGCIYCSPECHTS